MVRAVNRRVVLLAIALAVTSAPALNAQDATLLPRRFLTGSILAGQDRPVRFEDYHTWKEGAWDIVAGIGMGAFLTERWSLGVEVEVPRRGQAEVAVGSPQLPPGRILYWNRHEVRRRHVTAAGLLGFHPRRSARVHATILLGATVAHLLAQETYQELFNAGAPWRTIDKGSASSTHIGLITGLDVDTRLTHALAIVAQARGSIVARGAEADRKIGTVTLSTGTGDAGIARLGVGVRWMF